MCPEKGAGTFLHECHTRLFKAPKEWVAEWISRIKKVLEQRVEKSALLP